jgi:hypothetical protein
MAAVGGAQCCESVPIASSIQVRPEQQRLPGALNLSCGLNPASLTDVPQARLKRGR